MTEPTDYRPEFIAALRLFARISQTLHERRLPRPILVGGAAAELWSTSAVTTGDFDICTSVQPELEEAMRRENFVRPSGAGQLLRGWVHPELKLGFEIVANVPMDGNVDAAHIRLVQAIGETALFRVISVEDLIADRMGQYASGTAPDRLEQAQLLLALHPDVDLDYLDRRICEESGGDFGIEDVRR
ncbi:hypothetical protein [Sphingomonas psychrotolerans]|uniref:Nucleotidyl transferase AbiEii toxin, Type IV TA system n=1 Tax=Sphingomonas psychrotolerans TaxID=1327635 RepID=A0A2K8MMU7_9SPHN|nr:hypothetical protein [Sphingomonas psychrotolerans]ATY33986.1 hypothetical protein CVN68_20190 [Sphingomonas psychrotolerans]